MRRSKWSHSLVAGVLALAMIGSVTGLFGAAGTTIRITAPAPGARVSGHVDLHASISTSADVSYVLFGVDGDRPYSTNSTPYVCQLDTRTLSDGAHRIFVEAYDRYGMIGSSKAITIYVNNGLAPAVPAREQPATNVAAKPKTESAARVAARRAKQESARVVSEAESASDSAATSPATVVRGPRPEPIRSAAEPAVSAARPAVPALAGEARSASQTVMATPAVPPRPVDRTRGHTVVLNGRPVEFDVAPAIENGRMQAGFRAMFEATGAEVSWIPATRTARSVQPGLQVEVSVGERLARVNGRELDMGRRVVISENRTIIPIRFFADATGAAIQWNAATRVASLETRPFAIAERFSEN